MTEDILALAVELRRRQEPFALATVVRCERPTSAKPGAKALVRADGSVTGWVGGACAEPVVVREALRALGDGEPRLIALTADGVLAPGRTEGVAAYAMTCHSGGTLEIYVEPYLPKPLLVLVGHGPVIDALAAIGRATDFSVTTIPVQSIREELARTPLGPHAAVVVATHGSGDEDALEQVLEAGVGYVSLVASRKRAAVVVESLRSRGVAARADRPAQGSRRPRHRRGGAGGDRRQHPRGDHPGPARREARRAHRRAERCFGSYARGSRPRLRHDRRHRHREPSR